MSARARCAQILRAALAEADKLPVSEHARRAHCAGGPSLDELEQMIRKRRGQIGLPIAA